jgi:hypothetical protein
MGMSFVLVTGDPVDGINLVGPFEVYDDAVRHAEAEYKGETWWVVHVRSPGEDRLVGIWKQVGDE